MVASDSSGAFFAPICMSDNFCILFITLLGDESDDNKSDRSGKCEYWSPKPSGTDMSVISSVFIYWNAEL